jgi:hypothetical protein
LVVQVLQLPHLLQVQEQEVVMAEPEEMAALMEQALQAMVQAAAVADGSVMEPQILAYLLKAPAAAALLH